MAWSQYSPQDLLVESNQKFDRGDYADAMTGFAQLLSLDPSNTQYSYKYGASALYGDPSKREEAIKYLRYASGKPGVDELSWYFLGRAYHLNYQFADAISAYQTFAEKAGKKLADDWQINQVMETARNGQQLLSQIKEVTVLEKKKSTSKEFFRLYDLSDIGGKILVTPEELLSPLDKKLNHQSLIHFRGQGTTVYFSSHGKDGKNGLDIYSADVLPGGTFSSPRPLSGNVNTPYDDDFPYMHPDGKTFYFSSKGHSSMGGYDVFRSSYDEISSAFGSPQNMDFAINTPDDDILYIADSLNHLANFASGRSSRQGELHVYRVTVEMQSVELTLVKGSFVNSITPGQRTIKITVTDAATNKRIDVQYSDPVSGDYLLSFPKSGKYKLAVEAQNSERIHTAMVDIPKGDGLTAYLQEMELAAPSGLEKLIVNNLFDSKYSGDLSALAQQMLRKKAELEVNFDSTIDEEEPIVADIADGDDFKLAYNVAGFGAGLSNEKVLEDAKARLETMERNVNEVKTKRAMAASEANKAFKSSNALMAKASSLLDVDPKSDGGKAQFQAAMAQWDAKQALEKARVAKELEATLSSKLASLKALETAERERVQGLDAALASGDFAKALAALEAENEYLKSFDKRSLQVNMGTEVGVNAKEAREEADRYMRRATSMRSETEALSASRSRKAKELETAKGKGSTELASEIARLDEEIADLKRGTSKAYEHAMEKEASAARIEDQIALLTQIDAQALAEEQSADVATPGPDDASIEKQRITIRDFRVDVKAAEAYAVVNTEELAVLGSGNELRSFMSLTGVGTLSAAEAEEMMADSALLAFNATNREQRGDPGSKYVTQKVNDGQVEPSTPQVDTNFEASTPAAEEAKQEAVQDVIVANADEEAALDAKADSAVGVATPHPAQEANASENNAEDIAAIEAQIDAAKDWVSIIEESINEMEAEANAGDEDAAAQLKDYKRLRDEKQMEIAASNERIEVLKAGEQIGSASDNNTEVSVEMAFQDIESLDPAYVSRLESKINEASSTPAFISIIEGIDPDYISQLETIELSGKSAPEMATDRIELNKQLITLLNAEMREDASSNPDAERRLELRRIKALEVQEDVAVTEGKVAFAPRSQEAVEYAAMLAKVPEQTALETDSEAPGQKVVSAELGTLSPELREAIENPYSWDDVVPGYSSLIDEGPDEFSNPEVLEERIEAHKIMLLRLKDDIETFSALASSDAALTDPRIKQRYEQLLSERSIIADMLSDDAALLKRAVEEVTLVENAQNQPGTDSPDEVAGPIENMDDAESTAAESAEVLTQSTTVLGDAEWTINTLTADLEVAYGALESKTESTGGKLEEMAQLNQNIALVVSTKIDSLTQKMDATFADDERDQIQRQIQKLDAFQADKLQEADRLMAEAETAEIMTFNNVTSIDKAMQPAYQSTDTINATVEDEYDQIDLEEIQIADASPIMLEDYAFRSLQANINAKKLEESADIATAKRAEAKAIIVAYQAAESKESRLAIYEEFQEKANEVKLADLNFNKVVTAANESEVRYFDNSIEQIYNEIVEKALDDIARDEAAILFGKMTALKASVEKNHSIRGELDAFDTKAYAEMLKQERQLIDDMEKLNENIGLIATQVDAEVALMEQASTESQDTDTAPRSTVEPVQDASAKTALAQSQHEPLTGSKFVTPALQQSLDGMTNAEKIEMEREEPLLQQGIDFASPSNEAERLALIATATNLEAFGLGLIAETEEQMMYLSTSILADSLKKMESRHTDLLDTQYMAARERMSEIDRLNGRIATTTNAKDKKLLTERVAVLETETEKSLQKAALLASRAELLRIKRMEQEAALAEASSVLEPGQITALNKILKSIPYTVIASDLASAETVEAGVEKNLSDGGQKEIEVVKNESTDPLKTAVDPEYGGGNWLAMVEIFAEKNDFSEVKETLFGFAEKPIYNASTPIPVDPEMPEGLYFQVQVGAFRNPIPQDLFGEIAPLMGQKLPNGITRYRAGIFKQYRGAVEARDVIRSKGYSDAFVVVYLDGEVLTGPQARDILAQAAAKKVPNMEALVTRSSAPVVSTQVAEQTVPAYYNDPEAAEATQVELVRGLFYTVQVGVYSKPVKLGQLYNLSDLNSELTDKGLIRYTSGRYASVSAATGGKQKAIEAGVNDAFITAYYNGKRISLAEANAVLQREGESILQLGQGNGVNTAEEQSEKNEADVEQNAEATNTTAVPEQGEALTYLVILGQFGTEVPQEVANFFLERSALGIRRIQGPTGQSMYASPEFTVRAEAVKFRDEARAAGIDTAILATVLDGEIKAVETE